MWLDTALGTLLKIVVAMQLSRAVQGLIQSSSSFRDECAKFSPHCLS